MPPPEIPALTDNSTFRIKTRVRIELARLGDTTQLIFKQEIEDGARVCLPQFVEQGEPFEVAVGGHCSDGCHTQARGYRSQGVDFIVTRRSYCERHPELLRIWATKTPPEPSWILKFASRAFGI